MRVQKLKRLEGGEAVPQLLQCGTDIGSLACSPAEAAVHTQKLKRLQGCEGVPHLVEGGLGKHQGRSYVVMELFADDNLAVYQQKAALDIAEIKSIGSQRSTGL